MIEPCWRSAVFTATHDEWRRVADDVASRGNARLAAVIRRGLDRHPEGNASYWRTDKRVRLRFQGGSVAVIDAYCQDHGHVTDV